LLTDLLNKALMCVEGDSPLSQDNLRIDRDFLISRGLSLSEKRQKQWNDFLNNE